MGTGPAMVTTVCWLMVLVAPAILAAPSPNYYETNSYLTGFGDIPDYYSRHHGRPGGQFGGPSGFPQQNFSPPNFSASFSGANALAYNVNTPVGSFSGGGGMALGAGFNSG